MVKDIVSAIYVNHLKVMNGHPVINNQHILWMKDIDISDIYKIHYHHMFHQKPTHPEKKQFDLVYSSIACRYTSGLLVFMMSEIIILTNIQEICFINIHY